ncbi:MAG: hypothetical protein CMJ46_02980, partial [Planctomyces sp.]|nr:hypothetical protein [Planctomyces sp.]
ISVAAIGPEKPLKVAGYAARTRYGYLEFAIVLRWKSRAARLRRPAQTSEPLQKQGVRAFFFFGCKIYERAE